MALFYIAFLVCFGLNSASLLPVPWDQYVAIGASILIAPSFVLMLVGIHHYAPEQQRLWTHGAIVFGILYAALVSIVYATLLFVVEPHIVNNTQSQVGPFLFGKGTFTQMVDGLGYTYMGLAVGLTFPVFREGALASWVRWIAAPGVLVAYIGYSMPWGLFGLGAFLVPLYGVLVAIYFRTGVRGQ